MSNTPSEPMSVGRFEAMRAITGSPRDAVIAFYEHDCHRRSPEVDYRKWYRQLTLDMAAIGGFGHGAGLMINLSRWVRGEERFTDSYEKLIVDKACALMNKDYCRLKARLRLTRRQRLRRKRMT